MPQKVPLIKKTHGFIRPFCALASKSSKDTCRNYAAFFLHKLRKIYHPKTAKHRKREINAQNAVLFVFSFAAQACRNRAAAAQHIIYDTVRC